MQTKYTTLLLFFLFILVPTNGQTPLSPQQKAWLYRIVLKTPSLNRNWKQYFDLRFKPPIQKVHQQYQTDYDALEKTIIQSPDSLIVDWSGISHSSPGLVAEAGVKLALWELYASLTSGRQENPPFSKNKIANQFYQTILQRLPKQLTKKGQIKPKYQELLYTIMHPSLPISKKSELLKKQSNLAIETHKQLFETWHNLVENHVKTTSHRYFKLLEGKSSVFEGALIAAGEGSGSSGLLHEKEEFQPEKAQYGTGKGIGLFTYSLSVKKETITPHHQTKKEVYTLRNEKTLLHLSLWGMDTSMKPLIIVRHNRKSYLLFGTPVSMELTPDPFLTPGDSYLDRIEENRRVNIDKIHQRLAKDGGLLSVLDREEKIRAEIEYQISLLESSIDSLQLLKPPPSTIITNKKELINTYLTNLTKKKKRIKEIQSKLTKEYKRVSLAEKKALTMEKLLGPNPQKWNFQNGIFFFEDGSFFNSYTQDLVLPPTSTKLPIEIELIAATYSIAGTLQDEVQLYFNLTQYTTTEEAKKETQSTDTLFHHHFYHAPDAFIPIIPINLIQQLKEILTNNTLSINYYLNTCITDSVWIENKPLSSYRQVANGFNNKDLIKARRSSLTITRKNNQISLHLMGCTDPIPTRLSQLPSALLKQIDATGKTSYKNNHWLGAVRAVATLRQIQKELQLHITEKQIHTPFTPLLFKELQVKTKPTP